MLNYYADHARPIGLLKRPPCEETSASTRLEHAMRLPKRFDRIVKEHHAESAGDQIETIIGKWQVLRIALLKSDIS